MNDDDRLECGRTIDSVWSSLDAEPDEHQRGCAFCREARARLRRLRDLTREAEADDARLTTRPGVRRRIMDFARTHVRRGEQIPVQVSPGSSVGISERAIAAAVREAADAHPGVTARRCTVWGGEPSPDGSVPLGIRVGLVLRATADFGPLSQRRLRERVARLLTSRLGVAVATVDLRVEDVTHG
ncbi:hypothetical protein NBM05_04940 [Rothia sp. AR01]|uniref:Asp23/Gls24 family envelope stress response protein n=1 Tax=Rothia santali TaxID=2949643 RepID=A0A9X2KI17_9MICC|nr:hypothetical protein [Rothia santali]MCP3425379.1 hypothetical protein [Rothia santali]